MAAISFAGLCLPGSGLEQLGSNMVEFGWPSIVLGWTGSAGLSWAGFASLLSTRLGSAGLIFVRLDAVT